MTRTPLITFKRCVPPVPQSGPWWRYTVRTRSGMNTGTGMRQGSEDEVRTYLKQMQQQMEHRERPFGPGWREAVLRPDVTQY